MAGSFGLLFLAACSAAATDCNQDTFVVNTFVDLDDGSCDAVHCSLREAINAANSCTVHDRYTIELPPGDYELRLRGPDLRGDLNVNSEIIINGMGVSPNATVIRGEDTWVNSLFAISSDGELSLSNMTLEGGNTSANGGAVRNEGDFETENVIFSNNRAGGNGGAIYNAGTARIDTGSITGNQAFGMRSCGGGIYNIGDLYVEGVEIANNQALMGGGICNWGEADVETSNIHDNSLTTFRGSGGGIYDMGREFVIASGTTLRHNTAGLEPGGGVIAGWGGGIYSAGNYLYLAGVTITNNTASIGGGVFAGAGLDRLHIQDARVEGNRAMEFQGAESPFGGGPAPGGQGGGLALFLEGPFEILDSLIGHNAAEVSGGGLFVDTGYWSGDRESGGRIHHTAFIGNSSNSGGSGIFVEDSYIAVENTTFSNNSGAENTGLAMHTGVDGSVNLVNVTIANHAGTAVFARSGVVSFRNTLLAGNDVDCDGSTLHIQTWGGNGADHASQCYFSVPSNLGSTVSGPGFLPLTEVEGTWVHPLLPIHPAVDFVTDCTVSDDQKHLERPQGARCDSGAFEVEVVTISEDVGELEFATVTPTPGPVVATVISNARCRTGPGLVYADYDFFTANQSTTVYARIADSTWYQVQAPTLSGKCWIGQAVLEFDVTPEVLLGLPVVQPPATPTFTPEPGGGSGSAPDAPSGLQANETACNAVDGYKVKLTWNDNSDNESGFRIYHNGTLVATLGANVEQYTHTVPGNYGQQQSYYVAAYNDAGSANSNTAAEDGCLY
ncbi:MAG: CSLREA domain-containing protein [Anaerolineales bacterium]